MKCPKCQSQNPEGKKFCGKCGASLSSTCPHCSAVVPPEDSFCGECGQSLSAAPPGPASSPDSERKQATVLFSDLSGYTAMSEKLDPEEVKEIMGKVFGEISKVVAK